MIDSPETPGGCWAHFSAVAVSGYKTLAPGQAVVLEWETGQQDGYSFRAVRTWPVGQAPVIDHADSGTTSSACSSTLTITFDNPD